jgi:hypothetical protein
VKNPQQPFAKAKHRFIIGIDPGVKTGFAIYDRQLKKLIQVETMGIIDAQIAVRHNKLIHSINLSEIFVRVEDARKRKVYGKKINGRFVSVGQEVLQGVGSIKRDCSIWEEFLEKHGIDFEMLAPRNTKYPEEYFEKLTGWKERTSNHARDAAILVFGY